MGILGGCQLNFRGIEAGQMDQFRRRYRGESQNHKRRGKEEGKERKKEQKNGGETAIEQCWG